MQDRGCEQACWQEVMMGRAGCTQGTDLHQVHAQPARSQEPAPTLLMPCATFQAEEVR